MGVVLLLDRLGWEQAQRPNAFGELAAWLQFKLFLKMIHNKIKHTISNKYEYYSN
jgi:hypothetical protein